MLGEPLHRSPVPAQLLAIPPSPSSFEATVLPWYRQGRIIPSGTRERVRIAAQGSLGINVQCPPDTIDGYVSLLCREADLLRELLPDAQAAASLWLRGSPSRQFSPEAVTELIFRLSTRFPLVAATPIRGVELSVAALTAERLALLTGLGFNRVGLRVDATLGSDARSLTRLCRILAQLDDFPALGAHCEVHFGARSCPAYLSRVLRAIRRAPVRSIALVDPEQVRPSALDDRRTVGELLALAVCEMAGAGWASFGNAFFVPANSSLATPEFRATAHIPPWGPQPMAGRLWLGLGIGAFGYHHPCYYRTTDSTAAYREALAARQLPEKYLHCLPPESVQALATTQSMLCRHEVSRASAASLGATFAGAASARDQDVDGIGGSVSDDRLRLTGENLLRITAIIHHLHAQTFRGDHHVESHIGIHHGC